MERIKRFFLDESATAEATSTVVMVAGVAILLGAALATYYGALDGLFTGVGSAVDNYATRVGPAF
jgi:hypothetical protein